MYKLPKLKELSFLVYGLGLSGRSVVNFLKKKKIKDLKVWDDKEKNLFKKYRTQNLSKTLNQVNYIILAPGVSLFKKKNLRKFKKKIITDIDLFYLFNNKSKSIVVTGTNGKSTTCKLLAHLLRKSKFNVSLGGNIGTPILDLKLLKKDFVVIEASSFQLSHSQYVSPDFAFFLNLSNDHLDWHGNRINYLNAKLKIFKLQSRNNFALVNKKFQKILIKKNFLSKYVFPQLKEYKKIKYNIKNNYLNLNINDENMSFVYAFSKILKIKKKTFIESMKSFKGLPHRFEIFFKKKNTTFINDSKSTTFKSAQFALSSYENIYWIVGGLPKKGDYLNFSKYKKNIVKCYIVGKNINFFKNQIKKKLPYSITKNLKNSIIQILRDIKLKKNKENYVLLSPAAASFDQYKNFEERGKEFKKLCKLYG